MLFSGYNCFAFCRMKSVNGKQSCNFCKSHKLHKKIVGEVLTFLLRENWSHRKKIVLLWYTRRDFYRMKHHYTYFPVKEAFRIYINAQSSLTDLFRFFFITCFNLECFSKMKWNRVGIENFARTNLIKTDQRFLYCLPTGNK